MLQLRQRHENLANEMEIEQPTVPAALLDIMSDRPITNMVKVDNQGGTFNLQVIYGNATFNPMDEEIFDLIKTYAESNQELIDAVKLLKDESIPKEQKSDSSSKLKKFIASTAPKIGDVAFKLLTKYLENLMFGT